MSCFLGGTPVLGYEERTRDCYLVRLARPEGWPGAKPGQFVLIRLGLLGYDPLLRRPFSVYAEDDDSIALLVQRRGGFTARLQGLLRRGGALELDVLGPLGNGFELRESGLHVMVAGGIGIAGLGLLALELSRTQPDSKRVVLLGLPHEGYLGLGADFAGWGCEVRVSTEDGSCGSRGLVTELLGDVGSPALGGAEVYACGPREMLRAVARWAGGAGARAQLCMEEMMCCGLGVCLSCVVPVRCGDGWRWVQSCTEGPVFSAGEIVWEML